MPPRRKTHLKLTMFSEEDTGLVCTDGPIFSGKAETDEDLLCGRCHRTLFLAMTRQDVCVELRRGMPTRLNPALAQRNFPLVAECDCGAINRVWPPPLD